MPPCPQSRPGPPLRGTPGFKGRGTDSQSLQSRRRLGRAAGAASGCLREAWDRPGEGPSDARPGPQSGSHAGALPLNKQLPHAHWAMWGHRPLSPQTLHEFRPGQPGEAHFCQSDLITLRTEASRQLRTSSIRSLGTKSRGLLWPWASQPRPQCHQSVCPPHPGCTLIQPLPLSPPGCLASPALPSPCLVMGWPWPSPLPGLLCSHQPSPQHTQVQATLTPRNSLMRCFPEHLLSALHNLWPTHRDTSPPLGS